MRFGRNPGQNSCEADDVVCASPCEAKAKVKKQVGKFRSSGSRGGTLAWRLHLRRSRRGENQEYLKQQKVVSKDIVGCKVSPSEISTKRLAAFQWWSRKDAYRCSVLASASGLETTIADDPMVARWFACGWGGLLARRVGSARVCARREIERRPRRRPCVCAVCRARAGASGDPGHPRAPRGTPRPRKIDTHCCSKKTHNHPVPQSALG